MTSATEFLVTLTRCDISRLEQAAKYYAKLCPGGGHGVPHAVSARGRLKRAAKRATGDDVEVRLPAQCMAALLSATRYQCCALEIGSEAHSQTRDAGCRMEARLRDIGIRDDY